MVKDDVCIGILSWALFIIFIVGSSSCNNKMHPKKANEDSVPLKIMSFNIRMNWTDDGPNNWEFRKEYMTDLIKFQEPDLLGIEEAYYPQYIDMKTILQDYGSFGPIKGRQGAESVGIFYHKKRMELVDSSTFWLSETPEKQGLGWDAKYRRTVTWGHFRMIPTKKDVFFFVTHFDWAGHEARIESSKLVLRKIKEIAQNSNAFIVGDFNLRDTSEYYKLLVSGYDAVPGLYDTRDLAEKYYGPYWTLHDFGKRPVNKRIRIDYIFSNKKVRVTHFENIADQRGDVYPSDHNPQIARMILDNEK